MTAALIVTTGRTSSSPALCPLQEVGTIPAIQRAARILQRAGVERIVVVCGEDQEQVKKDAGHMGLVFLRGSAAGEMLDNVKTGLSYLKGRCDGALVTHVNVPLFSVRTVRALLEAEGEVRIPVCGGTAGHPVFVAASRFPDVLAYTGEGGLAGALGTMPRRQVEVEDPGVLANIAAGEDYVDLVEGHDLTRTRFELRLRLVGERIYYGPGPHQLLQLTGETGSLLEACRQMGISYSKGRKMVAAVEKQTGCPVITSRQGGPTGGSSVLTEEGRELVERYDALCQEANRCMETLFAKYFPQ